MVTPVGSYELVQSPGSLILRGRRRPVIIAALAAPLMIVFVVGIGVQNLRGDPGGRVPPYAERSREDQVAGLVIYGVMCVPFAAIPLVALATFWRRRSRPWVFDTSCNRVSHGQRQWPLRGVKQVRVDVGRMWNSCSDYADVVLVLPADNRVRVSRKYTGRGKGSIPISEAIAHSHAIAEPIAGFLKVPLVVEA